MANISDMYFAAKPARDVASILDAKSEDWSNTLQYSGFLSKLKSCYMAYHGAYYASVQDGHQITFGGEQGELVNMPVNQWRNIAQHMLNMTTSNRPALDCRASNTDYKSLVQTYLANNILEYYLREKKLEVYLKQAVEYAIVYGSGFIIMEWDSNKGELVDYIEETKTKIYEGDITFENLSPFDVMMDGTKESGNHDWVLVRRWKNKYDLAAKYPEFADKIKGLQTKSDLLKFRMGITRTSEQTDDVQVLEFYHKRTDSMEDGRYMMFLTSDIILQDLPMPYRVLPVFRISPSNIHGTPHGYTPMFDLLPLQEIVNGLYSTVASNQNAFGVQNVLVPRGTDIAVNQLQGGLNIIDYNATAGKPEALNLTNTPAEVFKFIEMIEQRMETLSGINSVARGQPEASLKSGTALALVQSMALQFMSGLQQSYVELIESVGTAIIKMLQDFAHTPRIVSIVGQSNRSSVREFNSKDISSISRVVVDVGNPMARTTAGRVQMADNLLQYGDITPKQYVQLIHTGNLNALTENTVHEEMLMKAENESIINGETPMAVFTENHKEHIDFHRAVLFDPELKKDAELVGRVQEHIQQHIMLLRTTDPDLLMLMNQQPLQPQQQPGQPPQGAPQQQSPQGSPPGQQNDPTAMMQAPEQGQTGPEIQGGEVQGPGIEQGVNIPNIPKVDPSLLSNPQLQQQALGNVRQ
jgi:hypothetical protein